MPASTVTTVIRSQVVNQDGDSVTKFGLGREQAENEPAAFWKAKKVARMDPDSAIEESQNRVVVGLEGGDAEDGVPAAFEREALNGVEGVGFVIGAGIGIVVECAVQDGEVGGDSAADLLLDGGAAGEPRGQRPLDGSVHGEEGVGDDFEAGEGPV